MRNDTLKKALAAADKKLSAILKDNLQTRYIPDLIYFSDSQCLEYVSEDCATVYETCPCAPELEIIKNFDGDIVGFKLSGKLENWSAFSPPPQRMEG